MANQPTKLIFYLFVLAVFFYSIAHPFITYPLTTLLKPVPILLLMIAVWQSVITRQCKSLLMLALGFSMLGDMTLTLPVTSALELGIGFFMLAHGSYIVLFLKNYACNMRQMVYFSPILILSLFMFFYLQPYVGDLLLPVSIYIGVLTTMVFCAFQSRKNTVLLVSGALLFMASDLMLAISNFVSPQSAIGVLILPVYYLAQLLIVLAIITPARLKNSCGILYNTH